MSALVSRVGVSRHLEVEVRLPGQPWESKKPRSRGIDLGFLLRALGGIRTPNLLIRSLGPVVSGRLAGFVSRSRTAFRQFCGLAGSGAVAVRTAVTGTTDQGDHFFR